MSSGQASVSVNADTLGALEKAADTTQLDDRDHGWEVGGGIIPPYPPQYLAAFQEINGTHAIAVGKKAQWEVGFGFDIVPHQSVGEGEGEEGDDDPSDSERDVVSDFWFGGDSNWKIGPKGTTQASPSEVFVLARRDYHGIGWACLEILTDMQGEPVGLAHIPALTARVRRAERENGDVVAGNGYVQSREARTRYFGEAGDRWSDDPTFVDQENGDTASSADELVNDPANELIFVPNPSPLALHYGIPDWITESETMVGDHSARRFNRSFFEWDALGQYAVVVEGGRLSEDSRDAVQGMINDLREKDGRRVAVLEAAELAEAGIEVDGPDPTIRIEKLTDMGDEDMSFTQYREANEHDVAKVHEVPPILLNKTESSNRSNSREQIRAFAEEVVAPEQDRFAERLYNILHVQGLGVTDWKIDFHLRGANNAMREAEVAATRIQGSQGVMKVNEARKELGLEELDSPAGEMLLAEVGSGPAGPAGPGGGVGGQISDMVDNAVSDMRDDVMAELRSTTPVEPDGLFSATSG